MTEERIVDDEQRRGPTRSGPARRGAAAGPQHPRRSSSAYHGCGYALVVAPWRWGLAHAPRLARDVGTHS